MQGVLTGFAVIAVVIAVGYVLGVRGHLGPQGREVLTKLAFHVASPALLFTTLATADLSVVFSGRLLVTALSTAAVAGVFVAVGVVRRWGAGRTTIGALCSGYVNSGNLGIPIAVYVL
ncbi:AEC family transporter, partial [Streptomyces geysiriensis]